MVAITRNCHTDYYNLLQMEYGRIEMLYHTLVELLEEENRQQEKAIEEAKSKGRR